MPEPTKAPEPKAPPTKEQINAAISDLFGQSEELRSQQTHLINDIKELFRRIRTVNDRIDNLNHRLSQPKPDRPQER